MTASAQLTVTFARDETKDTTTSSLVRIEQEPVSTTKLTDEDLQTMMAMVKAGIPASAYKPASCEAYIIGNTAYVDLALYVWPSPLHFPYTVDLDLVTAGPVTSMTMQREFDLVVDMTDHVDLPFYATDATWELQTPCYNRFGVIVEPPEIKAEGARISLSSDVFTVLRIHCTAHGYRNALKFSMAKNTEQSITDIKPAATVTWFDGQENRSASIELKLPACLESLLAACDDGQTIRDHVFGSVDDEDELVPTVYYTPCSGRMLQVRQERP